MLPLRRLRHGFASTTARIGLIRWTLIVGTALGVANCAGPMTGRLANKYGVKPSPKVVADGDPIPKGGGRAMVGKPYVVAERTYVPHDGKGYVREGWSSWYGTAFHGRLTANGEVFDRQSIAAAHPTLPLPSYVRVTNLVSKRSMVVRVNDRGPYEKDRLIDVSERAADALGFHRKGTTRVQVEYLGKAAIAGSDDAKLLATLRTDGAPAPFGPASRGVMVADLREPPASQASRRRAVVPVEPDDGDDGRTTPASLQAQAPTPDRVRLAGDLNLPGDDAEPLSTRPADPAELVETLPPKRPNLPAIY